MLWSKIRHIKCYETSKFGFPNPPGSGLDKSQTTLQLCIRTEGEQTVNPAIIFKGKGNVSSEERMKYDKDVDIYFQINAWVDAEVNMHAVEQTYPA